MIEEWFEDEEVGIVWSAERNQIRCIGHILNLIVGVFFKGKLKTFEPYDQAL